MNNRTRAEASLPVFVDGHAENNNQFRLSVSNITLQTVRKLLIDFDPDTYHTKLHAQDMRIGGKDLLRKMQAWSNGQLVTNRQIDLYDAVAATHDIFQPSNLKGTHLRRHITPERASADWLLFRMTDENNMVKENQNKPFTIQDWKEAEEAILTTQTILTETAHQSLLSQAKSPLTITLALYDINMAGLEDGPTRTTDALKRLFVEWKTTPEERQKLLSGSLSLQEEKPFLTDLFTFVDRQIVFVQGRMTLLPGEIDSIEMLEAFPEVKKRLKEEFSHFDKSLTHLGNVKQKMIDARESGTHVTFNELFSLITPPIPNQSSDEL